MVPAKCIIRSYRTASALMDRLHKTRILSNLYWMAQWFEALITLYCLISIAKLQASAQETRNSGESQALTLHQGACVKHHFQKTGQCSTGRHSAIPVVVVSSNDYPPDHQSLGCKGLNRLTLKTSDCWPSAHIPNGFIIHYHLWEPLLGARGSKQGKSPWGVVWCSIIQSNRVVLVICSRTVTCLFFIPSFSQSVSADVLRCWHWLKYLMLFCV